MKVRWRKRLKMQLVSHQSVLWDMTHKHLRLVLLVVWYARHFYSTPANVCLVLMFSASMYRGPCLFLESILHIMFLTHFLFYVCLMCRACILRFKDCPLCGADIEKIEPDADLQGVVDRFIEGHARIKRSVNLDNGEEAAENNKPVIYEDVSLERGSFLVQQAMRVCPFQTWMKSYIWRIKLNLWKNGRSLKFLSLTIIIHNESGDYDNVDYFWYILSW